MPILTRGLGWTNIQVLDLWHGPKNSLSRSNVEDQLSFDSPGYILISDFYRKFSQVSSYAPIGDGYIVNYTV